MIIKNKKMADDKKVIFSMSKLSKTYSSSRQTSIKNIYLSFFYGAKIGILVLTDLENHLY
jgi:hypothetical protein